MLLFFRDKVWWTCPSTAPRAHHPEGSGSSKEGLEGRGARSQKVLHKEWAMEFSDVSRDPPAGPAPQWNCGRQVHCDDLGGDWEIYWGGGMRREASTQGCNWPETLKRAPTNSKKGLGGQEIRFLWGQPHLFFLAWCQPRDREGWRDCGLTSSLPISCLGSFLSEPEKGRHSTASLPHGVPWPLSREVVGWGKRKHLQWPHRVF